MASVGFHKRSDIYVTTPFNALWPKLIGLASVRRQAIVLTNNVSFTDIYASLGLNELRDIHYVFDQYICAVSCFVVAML